MIINNKIWRCAGTVKIYSIQTVSYNAITAFTNKQAGALKHSSQIFWRLIAIVLIVAKTLLDILMAIMPMVIYRKEKNIMTRKIKITNSNTEPAHALNAQANGIYPYGFPFTLNLTMGCFFGCKYCYSPITLRKVIENKRDSFFSEVTMRNGIPDALKKDLERYSSLPQHLKRVQLCEQFLNIICRNCSTKLKLNIIQI